MTSLIENCALASGLTASMKTLPTGTPPIVKRPPPSVVAAYTL
jgi:hypothetical protein